MLLFHFYEQIKWTISWLLLPAYELKALFSGVSLLKSYATKNQKGLLGQLPTKLFHPLTNTMLIILLKTYMNMPQICVFALHHKKIPSPPPKCDYYFLLEKYLYSLCNSFRI